MTDSFQYPFKSNYETIDGVRLHYVDEGSGPPILMIHGQPTWSYLYRKMIPPLVAAGYRCVAPDLMGFGLSDKPTDESAYTLPRHVDTSLARAVHTVMNWPDIRDRMKAAILYEDREPLMEFAAIKAVYDRPDFPISK